METKVRRVAATTANRASNVCGVLIEAEICFRCEFIESVGNYWIYVNNEDAVAALAALDLARGN